MFLDKKQEIIHCSAIWTVFEAEHPIFLIFNSILSMKKYN